MPERNADPQVSIAVLFERIGHIAEKVDTLTQKIDAHQKRETRQIEELEERVERIEKQMLSVRWFLAGVAAAGGALGGSVAAAIAQALGG